MLAEEHGVGLHLLHATEPTGEALISPEVSALIHGHAEHTTDQLLEWIRRKAALDVTAAVVKGSPVWEIVRAGKGAGLTVVGSSSVDQAGVGPVAEGVMTYAKGDILVVRRQPRSAYQRIMIAVDLSPASLAAVRRTAELFPDANLEVVFVLTTHFDAIMHDAGMFHEEVDSSRAHRLRMAEDALRAELAPNRYVVNVAQGMPIETVAEVVRRRSADLTVVSSRGSGATRLTLLGTVSAGVARSVPTDVLVIRTPSDFRRP